MMQNIDCKYRDPLQIQQFNNVFEWLNTNNLYLNQNKGKTEFVLFGTPQRLSRSSKIEIKINNTMNLKEHLNSVFKKA